MTPVERALCQSEVRQADATSLPFDDASFDTVVSFIMLHHTVQWEKALAEAIRVVRPGGKLIAYDLVRVGPTALLHKTDGSGHRYVEVDALRKVLGDLPITAVSVRRGLAGMLVRFSATKR